MSLERPEHLTPERKEDSYTVGGFEYPITYHSEYIRIGDVRHTVYQWRSYDVAAIHRKYPKLTDLWKRHRGKILGIYRFLGES